MYFTFYQLLTNTVTIILNSHLSIIKRKALGQALSL